jgi:AmmeMemoRadiSam system protein A
MAAALLKRRSMRGCIGSLAPEAPLWQEVRDKAIAAATQDPRFSPVSEGELGRLAIEISVLSPLRKVKSAEEIQLGKHGVVVEEGMQRGVFLPQVATETGWSRDQFLSELCTEKAGLPPDAWKNGATLYVFTVEAFSSPAPAEPSHESLHPGPFSLQLNRPLRGYSRQGLYPGLRFQQS